MLTNDAGQVLLLKANYADQAWGLPGGALDMGETIHQALLRECQEELGCQVQTDYLSGGPYFDSAVTSAAFIFRCHLAASAEIRLSDEHTAYAWFDLDQLSKHATDSR